MFQAKTFGWPSPRRWSPWRPWRPARPGCWAGFVVSFFCPSLLVCDHCMHAPAGCQAPCDEGHHEGNESIPFILNASIHQILWHLGFTRECHWRSQLARPRARTGASIVAHFMCCWISIVVHCVAFHWVPCRKCQSHHRQPRTMPNWFSPSVFEFADDWHCRTLWQAHTLPPSAWHARPPGCGPGNSGTTRCARTVGAMGIQYPKGDPLEGVRTHDGHQSRDAGMKKGAIWMCLHHAKHFGASCHVLHVYVIPYGQHSVLHAIVSMFASMFGVSCHVAQVFALCLLSAPSASWLGLHDQLYVVNIKCFDIFLHIWFQFGFMCYSKYDA